MFDGIDKPPQLGPSGSAADKRTQYAITDVVPSRVAVAAEWTETIVTDHFTFEPGDRALEHYWLDRQYSIGGSGSG
jgi:hypothetical protein